MTARSLIGVLGFGALLAAAACAAPPVANREPLPACVPGEVSKGMCVGAVTPAKKSDDGAGTALKTTTGAPLAPAASDEAKAAQAKKAAGKDGKDGSDPDPAKATGPDATPGTATPAKPATPDPPAAPAPDPVGPMCSKLWTCCANLRAADMSATADQCDDSALPNDEVTCDVANEGYKTPTEFYDPVCF